jgi:thiol peroxidase
MYGTSVKIFMITACLFLMAGCGSRLELPIAKGSVNPATEVTFRGKTYKLLGTALSLDKRLPAVALVDAKSMKEVDLSTETGSVLLLSVVTSIDTRVCEQQTHYLGEKGRDLPPEVKRIVISRDTPFAQLRFAKEAHLENLQYLSDYKTGAWGRATGLLLDDLMLLARAVIIVDRGGTVRYIQVVPEITELPDMERAFTKAKELAQES